MSRVIHSIEFLDILDAYFLPDVIKRFWRAHEQKSNMPKIHRRIRILVPKGQYKNDLPF